MSSAATAGPPPNSHFHNSEGGRPAGLTNGYIQDGDKGKKSGRVFKHIKDLTAARPDININAPIRTILQQGEQHAKSAVTNFDFRRPDLAFEEYLKASIIAVEIIPRHKDYPELQSDRGELHRLYIGLQKRISSQQDLFDQAKIIIKENNTQNGTQPQFYSDHTNPVNGDVEAVRAKTDFFDPTRDKGRTSNHISSRVHNGLGNSIPESIEEPSTKRLEPKTHSPNGKKPVVHPKPEALQGKSIKPKPARQSDEDLATRFARLRGVGTSPQVEIPSSKIIPVQDPRINTRPIIVPLSSGTVNPSNKSSAQSHSRSGSLSSRPNRPAGPRDIPPARPLKIALGVEIPEMPRQPEAVYSPARSLESSSHGEGLTENRRTFNRASSMDLKKESGRGFMSVDDSNPYFYVAPVANQSSSKRQRLPDLSSLRSITAQQLHQFMQIGSHDLSILLVDIRNREDFDSGHIMWHSIICIEPITIRTDVSADEIEQSLVISPDAEQKLYMQRHTFSLVVYYDQSTSSSSKPPTYSNEITLQDFHKAVYDYGYENRLQNRPLLLEGGLDAWIDLVGERALATSQSVSATNAHDIKTSRPLARATGVPGAKNGVVDRDNPIREEQYHGNKVAEGYMRPMSRSGSVAEVSFDDSYFRTPEDFMRRFPAVSDIKESMISPSHKLILASGPPTRPEKAVTPGNSGPFMFSRLNDTRSATEFPNLWGLGHTGLLNRDNLCYMNAAIQALSSIIEMRDYLFRGKWLKSKPFQKGTLDDQQLATKTFSNLLMHLWSKDAETCHHINPRTFVATINRLHMHSLGDLVDDDVYGGPKQLDSAEFIDFLLQKLCTETAGVSIVTEQRDDAYDKWLDETSLPEAAKDAYQRLKPSEQSIIGEMMSNMSVKLLRCNECHKDSRVFDSTFSRMTYLNFPDNSSDQTTFTLDDLFLQGRTEDPLHDFKCKFCKQANTRQNNILYVRPPHILMIRLIRARDIRGDVIDPKTGKSRQQVISQAKIQSRVSFPQVLDLSKFQIPGTTAKYDCFAVVCHQGVSLKAGHNFTYRRDLVKDAQKEWTYGEWWTYNDTTVKPCSFSHIPTQFVYVLFYRLQGTF